MANLVAYSASMFGTGDIKNDSPNIIITDGVATLSVAQTGNIGIGVEIEYNSLRAYIVPNRIGFDSGGTAELLVDTKIEGGTSGATGIVRFVELISGSWAGGDATGWIYFEKTTGTFENNEQINRIKPTVSNNIATIDGTIEGNIGNGNTEFVVKTATGGTPANQSSISVTSIHHVWATIAAFEGAFTGANYINNTSLVTADVVVHCCCYYDHVDQTLDTTNFYIQYGTDDETHFLFVFSPAGTAESINSQRHEGKTSAGEKYSLQISNEIRFYEFYTRIEGLEISNNTHGDVCILGPGGTAGTSDMRVSKCVLHGFSSCLLFQENNTAKVWNNVIYDFLNYAVDAHTTEAFYGYNNTIFGMSGEGSGNRGINITSGVRHFYNNIVQDCGGSCYNLNSPTASSNNISSDTSSPDSAYREKIVTFVGGSDYHLAASDTEARDNGSDITSDMNIAVWRDIAGNERKTTPDIGAFEYVAAGATSILKILSETAGVTDSIIKKLAINKISNEAVIVSDSSIFRLSIIKILNVFIQVADSIIKRLAINKIRSESATGSDTEYNFLGLVKINSEMVNASDSSLFFLGLIKLKNEVVSAAENLFKKLVLKRVKNETASASDDNIKRLAINKIKNEPASSTDASFNFLSLVKVFSESVSAVETFAKKLILKRVKNETASGVDSASCFLGLVKIKNEISGAVENFINFVRGVTGWYENIELDSRITTTLELDSRFN